MKTLEEKTEEYINRDDLIVNYLYDIDYCTVKQGFIDGYNEANKWISVEDELPESSMDRLLVKYKIANGNEKFGIAKYFNIGIGNSWTIEGSCSREITHWRQI